MQCYIGEDLLYQFIYRYYHFGNINQQLVISGQVMVDIIVNSIIIKEQRLYALLNYHTKLIAHLVSAQFDYKVGGADAFYAAFGNFFLNLLSAGLDSLSQWSLESLTQTIQNQLKTNPFILQQINTILPPIKQRLHQIAYIHSLTNSLPQLNQNQIQLKKLYFLQSFINYQHFCQPLSKQKIKKNNKQSTPQKTKPIIRKNLNYSSFSSNKIQEQRKTQVDQLENHLLFQNLNSLSELSNQYQPNYNRNLQSNCKKIKHMINTQQKHQLLLVFDDLLPQKL